MDKSGWQRNKRSMKTAAEAMETITTGGWWETSPITRPTSPAARLLRPEEYDLSKDPPWFSPWIQEQITLNRCSIEAHYEYARRVEIGNAFYTDLKHTGRMEVWMVPT